MKRRGGRAIILIIPLLFFLVFSSNEETLATNLEGEGHVVFIPGFFSGNDYLKRNKDRRTIYIIGVIDGLLAVSSRTEVYKEDADNFWLAQCLKTGMDSDQVRAIVDKHLNENPELWHRAMNLIVYQAMIPPCGSYFDSHKKK